LPCWYYRRGRAKRPDLNSTRIAACPPAGQNQDWRARILEHFPEKWSPVFRQKMRPLKKTRALSGSLEPESALAQEKGPERNPGPWLISVRRGLNSPCRPCRRLALGRRGDTGSAADAEFPCIDRPLARLRHAVIPAFNGGVVGWRRHQQSDPGLSGRQIADSLRNERGRGVNPP
jgi:hypothetical protein